MKSCRAGASLQSSRLGLFHNHECSIQDSQGQIRSKWSVASSFTPAPHSLPPAQTAKLQSATLTENTKAKSQAVRMKNVKTELKGKQAFLAAYDEKVAMLHSQAQQVRGCNG